MASIAMHRLDTDCSTMRGDVTYRIFETGIHTGQAEAMQHEKAAMISSKRLEDAAFAPHFNCAAFKGRLGRRREASRR